MKELINLYNYKLLPKKWDICYLLSIGIRWLQVTVAKKKEKKKELNNYIVDIIWKGILNYFKILLLR